MVKDVYPGDDGTGPVSLVNAGGALYFVAEDSPTSGRGLWKSDGTEAGTVKVPVPDAPVITGTLPTALGAQVIFSAVRADNTRGLWRTDGTPGGTYLLANVNAGVYGQDGFPRVVVGDELYFAAEDTAHGRELWKTDGTVAGTAMVEDINPGPAPGGPTGGTALGDKLVFGARGVWNPSLSNSDDAEPWVSHGTEAGTFRLKDIVTTPQGSFGFNSGPFIPIGDSILFSLGGTLYRSDGTPQGTQPLVPLSLPSAAAHEGMGQAQLNNNLVVFAASSQPVELYASDGTAAGTRRLATLAGITPMPVAHGYAYFLGHDQATGVELWKTDGTVAGTTIVKDVVPGPGGITAPTGSDSVSGRRMLAAVNGMVFFRALDDQLWRTDGTAEGTLMVRDFNLPPSSRLNQFGGAGGLLYFNASAPGAPALWASDGSPFGTVRVAALSANAIIELGFRAVFVAGSLGSLWLYVSDGTEQGTVPLRDLGSSPIPEPHPVVFRGEAYYPIVTQGLFKTDGTAAGTVMVAPMLPPSTPFTMAVWNGALYFPRTTEASGRELWKTDGTTTEMVQNIWPGPNWSDPGLITAAGDRLFFAADDPAHGRELWKIEVPRPELYVGSSQWVNAFRRQLQERGLGDAVYGYRIDDKPTSDVIPWVNVNQVLIRFPDRVPEYPSGSIPLDGDRAGSDFSLRQPQQIDPWTFVYTISRPLGAIDTGGENGVRFTLSFVYDRLFTFRFNVLQGDVDGNRGVLAGDFSDVKNRFFRTTTNPGPAGPTQYSVFHDLDGSGSILANDFSAVKQRFFDGFLPAATTAAASKRTDEPTTTTGFFATTPIL